MRADTWTGDEAGAAQAASDVVPDLRDLWNWDDCGSTATPMTARTATTTKEIAMNESDAFPSTPPPPPMTDADLDRVERHAEYGHFEGQDYDAVETLVAEVRRLRDAVAGADENVSAWQAIAADLRDARRTAMNVNTGDTYRTFDTAILHGEKPEDLVEIIGTPEQVSRVSDAVKARRRAASKRARKSRKKNR